jgi:hypothetical protein
MEWLDERQNGVFAGKTGHSMAETQHSILEVEGIGSLF